MLETSRLYLKKAEEDDIPSIMEMERNRDNSDFVWQGTHDEHRAEIEGKDFFLFVAKQKEDNKTVGFILNYVDRKSEKFELRRIVISRKGVGYGREVMDALFKFAFEELKVNRFWLDVYPDNHIGIKLYEGAGMHRDGVLRQNYKSDRGYLDQIVYSILKSEYFKK